MDAVSVLVGVGVPVVLGEAVRELDAVMDAVLVPVEDDDAELVDVSDDEGVPVCVEEAVGVLEGEGTGTVGAAATPAGKKMSEEGVRARRLKKEQDWAISSTRATKV